jgi:hypothetical protein
LGAAIARSYYGHAADKQAALRTLLTSDDYRTILLESGYVELRGDDRQSVAAVLATCVPAR